MNPKGEFIQEGKSKHKESFKGATFLINRVRYPKVFEGDINNNEYASGPFGEFGIGAEYLKTGYYDSQHPWATWFAFRFAAGFDFYLIHKESATRFALMLDYTRGLSHNYFSDKIYTHFIAVKLVVGGATQLSF